MGCSGCWPDARGDRLAGRQTVGIGIRAQPAAHGEDLGAAVAVNRAVHATPGIAPSTPPPESRRPRHPRNRAVYAAPPSSDEFAALTITSACWLVISPCPSVIRIRPAY